MSDLPSPIAAFDDAQRRGIALLDAVTARVQVGMTPADVARLAQEAANTHGFGGWFHAPEVQRTSGRSAGWKGRLSRANEAPLREGDLLAIDLAPATDDAYADVGCTVVVGGTAEPRVLEVARACVRACIGYASRWKTVG
jgi:methionine aminopeptidase